MVLPLSLTITELSALHTAVNGMLRDRSARLARESPGFRRSLVVKLDRAVLTANGLEQQALAQAFTFQKQELESLPAPPTHRCHLLELPVEIREQIWIFTVTEWSASSSATLDDDRHEALPMSQKIPIRMDRFNRPLPPAITRTCTQIRAETLRLYYELNVFECWRPLFWIHDWSQSTFVDWLTALGPRKTAWINDIVLMYKHESELDYSIEEPLAELGFDLKPGVISSRRELSEYEMCFEGMGLPRHFGKKKRWDRWLAGSADGT